jgi:hypothetical protein
MSKELHVGIFTVEQNSSGNYDVCEDGKPLKGFTNKPRILAEFLMQWVEGSMIASQKLIQQKMSERN